MPTDSPIPIYFPQDERDLKARVLEEFDEFERSEHLRQAIRDYLVIRAVFDEAGVSFDSPRSRRHFIRQAMLDALEE